MQEVKTWFSPAEILTSNINGKQGYQKFNHEKMQAILKGTYQKFFISQPLQTHVERMITAKLKKYRKKLRETAF